MSKGRKGVPCTWCGRGYGSEYDKLCTLCRGRTAYEQKVIDGVITDVDAKAIPPVPRRKQLPLSRKATS